MTPTDDFQAWTTCQEHGHDFNEHGTCTDCGEEQAS